jgi:hypothetical protein
MARLKSTIIWSSFGILIRIKRSPPKHSSPEVSLVKGRKRDFEKYVIRRIVFKN